MNRNILFVSILSASFLASCKSTNADTAEPMDAMVSTEEVEETLDPNDPNVMVCPVTGAMERIDPDAKGAGDSPH